MITDDRIDKLIQPIIDRQVAIETYVLLTIAKRIKKIGSLSVSDLYRLEQLRLTGADVKALNAEIARLTGLQVAAIKGMIRSVAFVNYMDMKPFFDYRHKSFIPFAENERLQRMITAIGNQTANTYVNLSKTSAFMLRDMKNPQILKPTSLSETYRTVVDEAVQSMVVGTTDLHSAMHRTSKQLIDSGIQSVNYTSEKGKRTTRSLEAAVRQNVLEGTRNISQKMQDEIGKDYGSDGKELSAHPYSAPDHEPFQGLQFTNEQFERLQTNQDFTSLDGQHFAGVDRIIGQYNCRHVAWSIIIGFSPPNYTPEQLAKWRAENKKGFTDSKGKHRTMYECTQEQRRMERAIRKAKQGKAMAKASGDTEMEQKYKAKEAQLRKEYKAFSEACGLSMKPDRLQITT